MLLSGRLVTGSFREEKTERSRDVHFTRFASGTTEEYFLEAIGAVIQGGPFDEALETNVGIVGGASSVLLEPGQHLVWVEIFEETEEGEGENGEESPPTILVAPIDRRSASCRRPRDVRGLPARLAAEPGGRPVAPPASHRSDLSGQPTPVPGREPESHRRGSLALTPAWQDPVRMARLSSPGGAG